jgi:hypothetical protein
MSRDELRRDYLASDPVARLRQGFRLSRFGSRLRRAMDASYSDMANRAQTVELDDLQLRICSYPDLVAMKEATARDQDRLDLAALREARAEDG